MYVYYVVNIISINVILAKIFLFKPLTFSEEETNGLAFVARLKILIGNIRSIVYDCIRQNTFDCIRFSEQEAAFMLDMHFLLYAWQAFV